MEYVESVSGSKNLRVKVEAKIKVDYFCYARLR